SESWCAARSWLRPIRPDDLGLPQQLGTDRESGRAGRGQVHGQTQPAVGKEEPDRSRMSGEIPRITDGQDAPMIEVLRDLAQAGSLGRADEQDVAGIRLLDRLKSAGPPPVFVPQTPRHER